MMGAGPEVFALWPYIISNCDKGGHLEINPKLVAAKIGMDQTSVEKIIERFCQPEPGSRSKVLEGRKLERCGEFLYRVVNYEYYRNIRNAEDRAESNRLAQARYRVKHGKKHKRTASSFPTGVTANRVLEECGQDAADKVTDGYVKERDDIRAMDGIS